MRDRPIAIRLTFRTTSLKVNTDSRRLTLIKLSIISWWICVNFKTCCSKSKPNCYRPISHKFWKWKFAHLKQGGVTRRFVIWYSLKHFKQMFVTFCAIFAKTRLDSLNDYSERGLETKIKRGARTGGKYYVPNTHRNICNKSLNMQWVKVSLIFFLMSRKFWWTISKETYCVNLNSYKSTVRLL